MSIVLAAVLVLAPFTSTTGHGAQKPSYSYYAIMDGECEDLVVDKKDLKGGCVDKLVNVDFGDGRVSFTFGAATDGGLVTTEFNGGKSMQMSNRSYVLHVDALITTYAADSPDRRRVVSEVVDGMCTMKGDPTTERATFTCWARNKNVQTAGLFRSQGHPLVDHGRRADEAN